MTDARLERLLERAGDDGLADAQLRAWPVVVAAAGSAHAEKRAARGSIRRPMTALAIAAIAALLVAGTLTSPGSAVAEWVRDHVVGKPGAEHARPALTHLPGGGRMLVTARTGVWVVQADGSRRLLRGYRGATWSPRSLYVAAWRGHELFAVEPAGRVHWSLARRGPIRAADWSPDGYRVAYLSGAALRVVAGDGTGDRALRGGVPAVAPAWRPRAPHLLAFAAGARTVDLVATDPRALVWRRVVGRRVKALAWSADGRMLAVGSRGSVAILDGASGRARGRIALPPGFALAAMAFAHRGRELALTANSRDGRATALAADLGGNHPQPRRLFAGAGRFSDVEWSPDDRWVLIGWPPADQWLFLRSARVSGVSAVRRIAQQFDPGRSSAEFPAVDGWCCGP